MRDLPVQIAVLAFILAAFTLRVSQVSGVSMEPTLEPGSYVLVCTVAYRLGRPARGDVITFAHERMGSVDFVKRIAAVPGETIALHDGRAYVDGRRIDPATGRIFGRDERAATRVARGRYFVLGDDRPRSDDSRSFGAVPASAIEGRALAVVWPLSRVKILR